MKASQPRMSKHGRAIITYGRGWQSLAAVRSLGERGVEVVVGDEYAMTPSSFSRYSIADFRYPSPSRDPEGFLHTLEQIVAEYKPDDPSIPFVLLPIHKETYLIARNRERFEPHIGLPIPAIGHIEQVHSKARLAAYAQAKGLPTPPTWMPASDEEFTESLSGMALPAFIKIRESAAGVGIQKVGTKEDLEETFHRFVKEFKLKPGAYPIIQQAVAGDDYCVTTLFDTGRLVTAMTYRNLRAFPAEKGAGVLRETVRAPEMERISAGLLGSLGWHGVAELDFRWDGKAESTPYLIEVNPRFWGGLVQAIESGWDYPWLLYRLAVDGHVSPPESGRFDVRTETPILALLATLQDIIESDRIMADLKAVFKDGRREFKEGSKRAGMIKYLSGLKDYVDAKPRFREAKRLLEEHKDNIYDILSAQDPMPVLGILYPLAVFLKHGKVNMALLTSEGDEGHDHDE